MAGFFVGTSCGGILGDRHGRKITVLFTFLALSLFSIVGATTDSFTWPLLSRCVVDFGLGAAEIQAQLIARGIVGGRNK